MFEMPSSSALISAAQNRCWLTMASTARNSKRSGAEMRMVQERFCRPQLAPIGAHRPTSAKRR
ncbi:hypothetical protein D3C72_2556730 [compost metagenome]